MYPPFVALSPSYKSPFLVAFDCMHVAAWLEPVCVDALAVAPAVPHSWQMLQLELPFCSGVQQVLLCCDPGQVLVALAVCMCLCMAHTQAYAARVGGAYVLMLDCSVVATIGAQHATRICFVVRILL
jgi:hypothetical protein